MILDIPSCIVTSTMVGLKKNMVLGNIETCNSYSSKWIASCEITNYFVL